MRQKGREMTPNKTMVEDTMGVKTRVRVTPRGGRVAREGEGREGVGSGSGTDSVNEGERESMQLPLGYLLISRHS